MYNRTVNFIYCLSLSPISPKLTSFSYVHQYIYDEIYTAIRPIQCIVNGIEPPPKKKKLPLPLGIASPHRQEDRATAIQEQAQKMVKIARVVWEMCSRTDRKTHTHRQTDTLITILRHRFRGDLITLNLMDIR